ncbi:MULTISPECIES: transporter associated domain-containing protein [unclassified Halobacterium]|uniref:transporter associated domain-containing protein n=1 Tax=unclassified Halobacterium TaxID=2668073 RepID=UPI001E44B406|nr:MULTISPECIES: transporter associated domain-containing protein [unclassified Halobacterium]MCD2200726.1 hypothetical protein [Halobacterium sp. KA-4]MCD2203994.1 hypothetical protein [Halobacterium sp. KA-6]
MQYFHRKIPNLGNEELCIPKIDEWGAFEGLVTVVDVVEEIVGDILDQFDLNESNPSIGRLDTGGYTIDGNVPLTAVNEALNTSFESANFDTLGGFVLSRLGRAPEPDDTLEEGDHQLHVDEVDGGGFQPSLRPSRNG